MKKSNAQLVHWKIELPLFQNGELKRDLTKLETWVSKGEIVLEELIQAKLIRKEVRQLSFDFQRILAQARRKFIAVHGTEVYAFLTNNFNDYVRVEELIYEIAENYKALAPTRAEIVSDANLSLPQKQGYEISQGMILGELIALPKVGDHIMASMRQPKNESLKLLQEFRATGWLELETVKLKKEDNIGHLTISNPTFLNAEDDELNRDMEIATDLILLDEEIQIGVLRGDIMTHKKYLNKKVFCSGINLTKLYAGQLSYLYYATRELALMSKIFRGILTDEFEWNQTIDRGIEKPWIAAVDTHAIGGGAQLVLIADIVIADDQSYFTIPARTEGFIPGFANFRLQRYTGQRLARKIINESYKVMSNSEEGRLLVDKVVKTADMEAMIEETTQEIIKHGVQGMISNKKAFRLGVEPMEQFRHYMAMFCQEQATCMYDNEIIENLESFWVNKKKPKMV